MTQDHHPTALVVEDESTLADLYAAWLEDGYDVRTAYSGEAALERLDEAVDVVFLDRRMPGLSGDEVLSAIHDRGIDPRVAMVTAVEPDFDIIDMGFDDYLVKPVAEEELVRTADRLLDRAVYDSKLDEYATLMTKKVALETEKSETELAESDEFARLRSRIDELREALDPMIEEFDEDDFAAVFRDIRIET